VPSNQGNVDCDDTIILHVLNPKVAISGAIAGARGFERTLENYDSGAVLLPEVLLKGLAAK
jgi:hypothetical protein